MRNLYLSCLVCTFFFCCKSEPKRTQSNAEPVASQQNTATEGYLADDSNISKYEDGEYCATIEYYNSSTGNSSTYTLEVEIENGELVQINWPNGGWLDSSHFSPPDVDSDGSCSFSTYDGKDYEVQIDDEGGCSVSFSSPDEEEEEVEEQRVDEPELNEEDNEEISFQKDLKNRMEKNILLLYAYFKSTDSFTQTTNYKI